MNRIVITMTAKTGRAREVLAGVKAAGEYVTRNYDQKGDLFMQLYGTAGTIQVMSDYKDLASAQAVQMKIMADDTYWEIVKQFADALEGPPTVTVLQPL